MPSLEYRVFGMVTDATGDEYEGLIGRFAHQRGKTSPLDADPLTAKGVLRLFAPFGY